MKEPRQSSVSTLAGLLWAARLCGDRELERAMRRRLKEQYGLTVSIAWAIPSRPARRGAP